MSIRECARVQSFPDTHKFYYKNLTAGYKMVGNAVPSQLAYHLAEKIMKDIKNLGLIKDEHKTVKVAS